MKAYWTDAKPDGSKITDGRLCRIVDAEDGSLPVRVYGRTEQEVFDKIERTMMTAQMRLTQERGATTPQRNAPHAPVAPAADPAILSADEIMRLTQEQQNPAKSAEANARLADHHRALQRKELTDFAQVCERWQRRHPELVDSLFNKKLITDNARMRSGSLKAISEEVLEQVYQELQAGGYLLTEESAALHNEEPITPTVPPAGRQGARTREADRRRCKRDQPPQQQAERAASAKMAAEVHDGADQQAHDQGDGGPEPADASRPQRLCGSVRFLVCAQAGNCLDTGEWR